MAKSLGKLVKEVRVGRGISLEGLAQSLGVNPDYLSALEADKVAPSIRLVKAIARIIRCEATSMVALIPKGMKDQVEVDINPTPIANSKPAKSPKPNPRNSARYLESYRHARYEHAFLLRCEGCGNREIAERLGSEKDSVYKLVRQGASDLQRAMRRTRFRWITEHNVTEDSVTVENKEQQAMPHDTLWDDVVAMLESLVKKYKMSADDNQQTGDNMRGVEDRGRSRQKALGKAEGLREAAKMLEHDIGVIRFNLPENNKEEKAFEDAPPRHKRSPSKLLLKKAPGLRYAIEASGGSQRLLAKALDVHESLISSWGDAIPDLYWVRTISRVLHLPIVLLEGDLRYNPQPELDLNQTEELPPPIPDEIADEIDKELKEKLEELKKPEEEPLEKKKPQADDEFKIIKGVVLPGRRVSEDDKKYPFEILEDGETFFIPGDEKDLDVLRKKLSSKATQASKMFAKQNETRKFSIYKVQAGQNLGAYRPDHCGVIVQRIE